MPKSHLCHPLCQLPLPVSSAVYKHASYILIGAVIKPGATLRSGSPASEEESVYWCIALSVTRALSSSCEPGKISLIFS